MAIWRAGLRRVIFPAHQLLRRSQSTQAVPAYIPVNFAIKLVVMPEAIPLKPDLGPNNALLPPLPEIHDKDIKLKVFTHRSYHARPVHVFEDHPTDPSPDNEKFEHLGDTVLGLCVTSLMNDMYPHLHVGPSTKIRAMVVGNSTLASISVMYKLPERLRLHPAQAITLRASTNIQADLLESYIGGLYTEQGLEPVKRWLDPLFKPYTSEAYGIMREHYGLPPVPTVSPLRTSSAVNIPADSLTTVGHLALFNQHLQKSDSEVEWVYSEKGDNTKEGEKEQKAPKTTPVWYVKVLVNGEVYGNGKGNTKKAARNEAAKVGLVKMGIIVWYVFFCSHCMDVFCLIYIMIDLIGHLELLHGFSRLGLDVRESALG